MANQHPQDQQLSIVEELDERLFHELNLLRLEGVVFAFDPKGASRKTAVQRVPDPARDRGAQEVVITPHPIHGYPSVLAYKIFQAILKKLSDYGFPARESLPFTQRELAKEIGRSSFGGKESKELLKAAKQLRFTDISCSLRWKGEKKEDHWIRTDLSLLQAVKFSGRGQEIDACVFYLNSVIVESLNNRHSFCLNFTRLKGLEPISVALYKQVYYRLSNLYSYNKQNKSQIRLTKDYADICATWLGGLKSVRFQSQIEQNLGPHLKAIKNSGLISSYRIEKNADATGFNITFVPGKGFFEDYHRFYLSKVQPQLSFRRSADEHAIQHPLELVSYFYRQRLGVETLADFQSSPKEMELAREILKKYSPTEAQKLVDFALAEAPKTKFDIKTFGAIRQYLTPFVSHLHAVGANARREEAYQREQVAKAREEQFEKNYQEFRNAAIAAQRSELSAVDQEAIEADCRRAIEDKYGSDLPILKSLLRLEIEFALARRGKIPSYEDWRAEQLAPAPIQS